MIVPVDKRRWFNTDLDRHVGVLGAGDMPVNYLDDGDVWRDIVLDWEQVNATSWRAQRGPHRAILDTNLGVQFGKRDHLGVWHTLGMQSRHLVKLKLSDLTFSSIAQAQAPSLTLFNAGNVVLYNVFPDINCTLEYFNDSFTLSWTITQAARDSLASAGPWAGHAIGIATELDPSGMTAQWRDHLGAFDINVDQRYHAEAIDVHVDGTRVWALAKNYIQYDGFDPLADNGVPVYKLIVKRDGKIWLVEAFSAVAAAQLPPGDLRHNATFGNTSEEAYTSSLADTCLSYLATPSSSGTADNIKIFGRANVSKGTTLYAACALYTDASPPLGSGVLKTDERHWTIPAFDNDWTTFTYSSPPSITGGVALNIAGWSSKAETSTKFSCQAGTSGGTNKYRLATYNYGTWADLTSSNALKLSIYCTYTESGGVVPMRTLLGVGV